MDELAITKAKLTLSRAEFFMEKTKFNAQIQPIPLKSLEEEMTPMVTSYTHSTNEKEQPVQDKGMSIQELAAKYMNGNENVAIMSHEGQHETLQSNLEVTKEEENLNYCDAPKSGGLLTTRQPTECSWMSGNPTPLTKIGQSLICTGSSTQGTNLSQ